MQRSATILRANQDEEGENEGIKRTGRVPSSLPSILLALVKGSHVAETRAENEVLESILHLARSNDILGVEIVLLLLGRGRESGDSRVGGSRSSRDSRSRESSDDSSRVEGALRWEGRSRSAKAARARGEETFETMGGERGEDELGTRFGRVGLASNDVDLSSAFLSREGSRDRDPSLLDDCEERRAVQEKKRVSSSRTRRRTTRPTSLICFEMWNLWRTYPSFRQ